MKYKVVDRKGKVLHEADKLSDATIYAARYTVAAGVRVVQSLEMEPEPRELTVEIRDTVYNMPDPPPVLKPEFKQPPEPPQEPLGDMQDRLDATGYSFSLPAQTEPVREPEPPPQSDTPPLPHVSEAARAMGKVRSPRKTASSRANISKAHAARSPQACTCGQDPHRYTCPAYLRQKQRESRARKQAAQ